MRNLKKFLALVLAMMMVMSLMLTVNAASSSYQDADKIDKAYTEAVTVLSGLKVLQGDDDGFRPTDTITRAEMAAVLYRIYTGRVGEAGKAYADMFKEADNTFDDVTSKFDWAKGYINYAYIKQLVKGDPSGTYRPGDPVTGYEVLAMLLRAIGYTRSGEFEGVQFIPNVTYYASELGIIDNIKGSLSNNATRQQVAEMAFRAMNVTQVSLINDAYWEYPPTLGGDKNLTLGEQHFGLTAVYGQTDGWGRPATEWYATKIDRVNPIAVIEYPAAVEFPNYMSECDVYDAIDKQYNLTKTSIPVTNYWVDGVELIRDGKRVEENTVSPNPSGKYFATKSGNIVDTNVDLYMGHNASYTEVYYVNGGAWVVERSTYLAQVKDIKTFEPDIKGHTRDPYTTFNVYVDNTDHSGGITVGTLAGVAVDAKYKDPKVYVLVNFNKAYGTVEVEDSANLDLAVRKDTALIDGYVADHDTDTKTTDDLWDNLPGTTTVDSKYNNAWQFNLGRNVAMAYDEDVEIPVGHEEYYYAITDAEGNIYGLVADSDCGWLIIEKLEWEHRSGEWSGYAMADVIYGVDGTVGEKVTINSITPYGKTTEIKLSGDTIGDPATGKVSDDVNNNTKYYYHIFWYTKGENNSINLFSHPEYNASNKEFEADGSEWAPVAKFPNSKGYYESENRKVAGFEFYDLEKGTLTENGHEITGIYKDKTNHTDNKVVKLTNTVVVNDYTKFLVRYSVKEGYKYYEGRNKIEDLVNAEICVVTDKDTDYALLVVADGSKTVKEDDYLIAYVNTVGPFKANDEIDVYPLGSTEAKEIKLSTGFAASMTGIYVFKKDSTGNTYSVVTKQPSNGRVMASPGFKITAHTRDEYADIYGWIFDNGVVKTDLVGSTLQATTYTASNTKTIKGGYGYSADVTGASALNDYLTANATFIKVTKGDTENTVAVGVQLPHDVDETLSKGKASEVKKDMLTIVVYQKNAKGQNVASVVYYYEAVTGESKDDSTYLDVGHLAEQYWKMGIRWTIDGKKITFTWDANELNKLTADTNYNDVFMAMDAAVGEGDDAPHYLFLGVHFINEAQGSNAKITKIGNKGWAGSDETTDCQKADGGSDLYFNITSARTAGDGDSDKTGAGSYGYSSLLPGTYSSKVTINNTDYIVEMIVTGK